MLLISVSVMCTVLQNIDFVGFVAAKFCYLRGVWHGLHFFKKFNIFGCIWVWTEVCIISSDIFNQLLWFNWAEAPSLYTLCFVCSDFSDYEIRGCQSFSDAERSVLVEGFELGFVKLSVLFWIEQNYILTYFE